MKTTGEEKGKETMTMMQMVADEEVDAEGADEDDLRDEYDYADD